LTGRRLSGGAGVQPGLNVGLVVVDLKTAAWKYTDLQVEASLQLSICIGPQTTACGSERARPPQIPTRRRRGKADAPVRAMAQPAPRARDEGHERGTAKSSGKKHPQGDVPTGASSLQGST